MFYLGIDVGKFHHSAALVDHEGKVTATLPSFSNTETASRNSRSSSWAIYRKMKTSASGWRPPAPTGSR